MNYDNFLMSKKEQRARRKDRRANMSTSEKCSEFFITLAQIITFILGGWGAYALADFLESVTGFSWYLLGFLLYIAVGYVLLILPGDEEEKAARSLSNLQHEYNKLESAAIEAVESRCISPLYPFCDPSWLSYLLKQSQSHGESDRPSFPEKAERSPEP